MGFIKNIFSPKPRLSGAQTHAAESDLKPKKPYIFLESEELTIGVFRPQLTSTETVKLDTVLRKLEALRIAIGQYEIDGLTTETGIFPSSLDDISAFEKNNNLTLPEDFKALLEEAGYDIFPYHKLTPSPDVMGLPLGDGSDEIPIQPDWYVNAKKKVIEISDFGCGIYFIMCLFEPEHGNIWILDGANTGTASPVVPENEGINRVRFLDWYNYWLDAALAEIDRDLQ